MKKIVTSLLILTISVSAFGAYKAIHKKKKKKVVSQKATIVNDTKIKSVLMGRSACFGTCPSYTIEVFENGTLRYNGKHFVDKEGLYEKQISPNDAIRFIQQFNSLQPDTLHYLYQTKIADLPGIYYFIQYPDSVKHIINADAGPRILYDWSLKFDEFAKFDKTWAKVKEDKATK